MPDESFMDRLSRFVRSIEVTGGQQQLPQQHNRNSGILLSIHLQHAENQVTINFLRRPDEPYQQDRIADQ